jgi:RNA polymerase sigma factor (sigma-70 family)
MQAADFSTKVVRPALSSLLACAAREVMFDLLPHMEPLMDLVLRCRTAPDLKTRLALADELLTAIGPELYVQVKQSCRAGYHKDVHQEVLLAIFRRLPDFKGETDKEFWAWCRSIAHNKAVDSLRGIERRPEDPTDLDQLREFHERSLQDQPANFAERDLCHRALELVGEIQPPCREFLVQRFVFDRDYETIAEALNLSYDAVRMRVARCLELANELLSQDEPRHE